VGFFASAFWAALRETPKGTSFSHERKGRAFLCAPYVADEDGRLRPVGGVDRCPQAAAAEPPCRLSWHGRRLRKAGPAFPLGVGRCRTHGGYFTVYPPGFTPFARQRIAPAEPPKPRAAPAVAAGEVWSGTVFEAATQAATSRGWERDPGYEEGTPKPRHSTVRRRVAAAARLLGLCAETSEREAEVVAQVLALPGLDHTTGRRAFAQAASLRERGAVVVSVLERLSLAGSLERRLLTAGCLTGLWGPALLWDARSSRAAFPMPGTSLAKSARSPPIAPHESVPPPSPGLPRTVPRT
jgi:hypothetical protein